MACLWPACRAQQIRYWPATELFEGVPVSSPVLIVNGASPGPTLCMTAAVHGDELNGIEMVRRIMHDLDPQKVSGAIIGVPIVNVQAFRRGSRYLPDRRDLNRYFPGNPNGSAAARIAHFDTLGMINKISLWGDPESVYYRSSWVRADNGGILLAVRRPNYRHGAQPGCHARFRGIPHRYSERGSAIRCNRRRRAQAQAGRERRFRCRHVRVISGRITCRTAKPLDSRRRCS